MKSNTTNSIAVKVATPYTKSAQKYIGWDKDHVSMTDFANRAFKLYLEILGEEE
jgi:hypothetical protein